MITLLGSLLYAATLANVTLPDQIHLEHTSVYLRGIGLREKYWIDIYVAGLYVPQNLITNKATASDIIQANVHKRIHTHFIFPHVPKEKMIETLEENIKNNPNISSQTIEKIRKTQSWMEDYEEGDEIIFDYIPSKGTVIIVKGTQKGVIKGEDFMQAIFAIYIGENPASEQLKHGLLK